jgi:DNA-directed RNA polymerase specialized sigma24 family protein
VPQVERTSSEARIVELRVFGGQTGEETAELLGVSAGTVSVIGVWQERG